MAAGHNAGRGRGDAATGGGGGHNVRGIELADHLDEVARRVCSVGNNINDADGQRSGAGVASGVDGVFIETHPEPEKALCDAASQLCVTDLEEFMKPIIEIHNLVNKYI